MTSPAKLLVVDDDVRLCEMIASYLSNYEYEVSSCHSGDVAIELIRTTAPDLVILDLMLPGADGLSVCRAIRNDYPGRILMLTALDDSADEIAGLETGADDYMAKPVSPRLLLARIRTLLRRTDGATTSNSSSTDDKIALNDIAIDASSRSVTVQGSPVKLSTTEFDLLWLMAKESGTVLSREHLHASIYRLDLSPTDRRIDLLVSRLRRKLGDDSTDPQLLKTIRGKGYLLSPGQ